MARGRHSRNPAKVKAQIRALDGAPPPDALHRRVVLRRRVTMVLLGLLTVVLLSVSFAPFDQWYLAYVALVPWLLLLSGGARKRETILWAALTGALFWAANLYWLWWITLPGYAAMVVYLSAYWLVAALLIRSAMRRDWPMWIVFPVVWVALEYARAYVISGFPWFYLAHSQYAQTRLIQIADITGQYGVSFFVAMVNGALVDLLESPLFVRSKRGGRLRRQIVVGALGSMAAVAGLLGYGTWRLSQDTRVPGPILGIVQQAFPISLGRIGATEERVLESHRVLSEGLVGKGCDLVIWPETMLPTGSNREFLDLDVSELSGEVVSALAERISHPEARKIYGDRRSVEMRQDDVRELLGRTEKLLRPEGASGSLGCPILAGGAALYLNPAPMDADDYWLRKNSALLLNPARGEDPQATWNGAERYSKVHLVPFSEYVPFKRSWKGLYRLLRWFVPREMDQLEPGSELTNLTVRRKGPGGEDRTWVLATPICYEGTFARVCRRMVRQGGRKSVDILANLSNDGWFIWQFGRRGYHRSTEHAQHLAQYCFRAVENRTPVVRAVNTGISASIDSNGRIVCELRQYDGLRTMVAGVLLLDGGQGGGQQSPQRGPVVLVDRRVSVYSCVGDVFAMLVSLVAIGIAIRLAWKVPKTAEGAPK
ncbi:MAG TPA: apolipoprotein N-acyltransferase [Phycisphaerae bacterium]|nr:apolipoprotein N-acyltransferase [Phycisphaerae bacterium]